MKKIPFPTWIKENERYDKMKVRKGKEWKKEIENGNKNENDKIWYDIRVIKIQ